MQNRIAIAIASVLGASTVNATATTHPPRRERARSTAHTGGKRPLASVLLLATALLVAPVAATLPVDTASTWVQTDKLTAEPLPEIDIASDLVNRPWVSVGQDDWFGQSLALSGGLLAVGAPRGDFWPTDEPGEVFLYEQGDLGWVEVARFSAGLAWDNFGWSVDFDGTTLVVGAPAWEAGPGAAYVYEAAGEGGWTLVETLTAAGTPCFGASVAVAGEWLVVGAPCQDNVDAVIYERGPGGWTESEVLVGSSGGWHVGQAVDLSHGRVVVGGVLGSAYVYDLTIRGTWEQVAVLEARRSGAVAVHGERIAVGVGLSEEVLIFEEEDGLWHEVAVLEAPSDGVADWSGFGQAVAFSGDAELLVVGARADDPTPPGSPELPDSPVVPVVHKGPGDRARETGAVHVFEYGPGGWAHVAKLVASDARSEQSSGDWFGASVAVSPEGDRLFAGAPRDACCDDPMNAGLVRSVPLVEGPCGFSTFTCFYEGHEADAVYVFTVASDVVPGGLS